MFVPYRRLEPGRSAQHRAVYRRDYRNAIGRWRRRRQLLSDQYKEFYEQVVFSDEYTVDLDSTNGLSIGTL